MPSSIPFTGSGFSVQSAISAAPGRVRIRFTQAPLQVGPGSPTDGLHPQNYTLTGPGAAAVSSVGTVSGDPQSLDLYTSVVLAAGTWVVAVANVLTPGGSSLTAPLSASFVVTDQANVTELTAGAEPDDPARIIRKHLSPALVGPSWDALIEALSQGDDMNWTNARLAFDQLFKTSASGKYLDRLASNDGLTRPANVGIGDDVFRQLAIRLTNNKITHEALREILETYYGRDALRAYAETALEEPYALAAGRTLTWTLDEDEGQEFQYLVLDDHYTLVGAAKAIEVAAALTKVMRDAGSEGFAVAVTNAETGNNRVRIYSGSLGLKSFVRVTGGTAQPGLRFPTYIETYSGTVTVGLGYSWVVTKPSQNVTRLTLTTVGQPLVDVSGVEAGDYLVIGPGVTGLATGSYPVLAVSYSWSGASLTQIVDLDVDLGFTGAYTQAANDDFRFFRPTRTSVLAGSRTVVVAQTVPDKVDVQIPATTQAVNRTVGTGAYGRTAPALDIKRYVRDGAGLLTIYPETAFTTPPAVNSQIIIEGARPAAARPWVSQGTPGTSPAVGTSDASYGTTWSGTQIPPAPPLELESSTLLTNGDLLLAGGILRSFGSPSPDSSCNRFRPVGTQVVTDASEAEGAIRKTYQWIATAAMPTARYLHRITTMNDGRALATGGLNASGVQVATTELYNPGSNTWSSPPSLALARVYHQQVTLGDGRVLVCGGSWNTGTATPTTELFNPGTLTWSPGADMAVPRAEHRALRLPDGRVFVTGGATLGQRYRTSTPPTVPVGVLAYWPFDEAAGSSIADTSGNGYTLTVTGTGTITNGKVARCRTWGGGADFANGAGSGAAVTALLGEWTVEFWLPATVASPSLSGVVAYSSTGGTSADNALMLVGVTSGPRIWWKWQNGTKSNVTATQTLGGTLNSFTGGVFVALRKKDAGGGLYDVDLFLNGVKTESWLGQANASGGGSSSWWINTDPDTGNKYASKIDEVRVSSVARTDEEILRSYLQSGGLTAQFPNVGGDTNSSTEFYDPVANTWTPGPPMNWGRSSHQMTALSDGRVLVFGGTGRQLDKPLPPQDQFWYAFWPNTGIRDAEIWDPVTNRWSPLPGPAYAWGDAMWVNAADRQKLYVTGTRIIDTIFYGTVNSVSVPGDVMEMLDLRTLRWSRHFLRNTAIRDRLHPLGISGYSVATGGFDGGFNNDTFPDADLLIPGADSLSGGGINGLHTVVSSTSSRVTVATPAYPHYSSNIGNGGGFGGTEHVESPSEYTPFTAAQYSLSTGQRLTNVTTLTLFAGKTTVGLSVGQRVFVNLNGSTGLTPGFQVITALTSTTISYADTGADTGVVGLTGAVNIDQNSEALLTQILAPASVDDDTGPYIYDPASGLAITGTATTLTLGLQQTQHYDRLTVASATGFPDGSGYLVLAFGTAQQSKPIRYLEVVGTNLLLLDFGYAVEQDYPAGTTVTLLRDRNPFVPDADEASNFWVTGSSAGRVAAQASAAAAAAAGIELDFNVIYPGDRGLGGEGYPTEGDGKLSDATRVWGGDDLDEET